MVATMPAEKDSDASKGHEISGPSYDLFKSCSFQFIHGRGAIRDGTFSIQARSSARGSGWRRVWIVFGFDLSVTNPLCLPETAAGPFEGGTLSCSVWNHSEGHLSTPVS
jgi:hypothetical protein